MENTDSSIFNNTEVAFSSKTNTALRRAYFLFVFLKWDKMANIGIFFLKFAIKTGLPIKWLIKNSIFQQFCGGETLEECMPVIDYLKKYGIHTILDFAVEAKEEQESFEQNMQTFQKLIQLDAENKDIVFSVLKISSLINSKILEKLQHGISLDKGEEILFIQFEDRINTLLHQAAELGIKMMIDAEESWIQGAIDHLAMLQMKQLNRDRVVVFNTYQMYLKEKLKQLESDINTARENGYRLGVKLVRGAYMEKERARAQGLQYLDPISANKAATDHQFNEALRLCIANLDIVELCCGSHNEYSNALLTQLLRENHISSADKRVYFAQLYGMSEHISYTLANLGFNVAKYLPFGQVTDVIPYLIRRAQENKSITGQVGRELALIQVEIKRRKLRFGFF